MQRILLKNTSKPMKKKLTIHNEKQKKLSLRLVVKIHLTFLKSATGLGMDPKQYERRSRGEVQRGMEPREFISGGFKLKDMSGFDTLEKQKELSDFLQKYGTANRIGQGLAAAEIALGAPALFKAGIKYVPKVFRTVKEKVAPFVIPGAAVPATIGAFTPTEAEAKSALTKIPKRLEGLTGVKLIETPEFEKNLRTVYRKLKEEGKATAVNVKKEMDKLGYLVGMNRYIGASAHPIMPKFPKTGGREAGKGEVFMSPAAEASVKRYKSPEFKQEVIDKFNELTVHNFNGDIIATPSRKQLNLSLGLKQDFDYKKYFDLDGTGIRFTSVKEGGPYLKYVQAQERAKKLKKITFAGRDDSAGGRQLFFPNQTSVKQLLLALKNKVYAKPRGQSDYTKKTTYRGYV